MNQSQSNKLLELYGKYFKDVRPLLVKSEELLECFPNFILRELRNYNDHISRAFMPNVTSRKIDIELSDAENHLQRCILDCYKSILAELETKVDKFREKYQSISLGLVGNGNFYPKFSRLLNQNRLLVYKAKEIENSGERTSARKAFKEAGEKFFELMKFIEDYESSGKLKWATRYTRRRLFLSHSITFISGIAVTVAIKYSYGLLGKGATIIKNFFNN